MKKIFLIFFLITIFSISIPLIFTKKFETQETVVDKNEINKETIADYNYGQYSSIKLLHKATGEIEEMTLDEYLYGVVASEMPANFAEEALKAQAIVARTYTIYCIKNNLKHENSNICDDSNCCQAWISKNDRFEKWNESDRELNWAKIVDAVNSTKGKIVTYNGEPINAFFHSNSGGKTETADAVWGGTNYPYLQTVETSGEDEYSQYNSEVILSKQDTIDKIKEFHSDVAINFQEENAIQITEYTNSGRVRTVKFGNLDLSGTEVRNIFRLKSTNFTITAEGENIKFAVIGYGHGVGMSQTGADSMAKDGSSYEEIIKHFYSNIEISNL